MLLNGTLKVKTKPKDGRQRKCMIMSDIYYAIILSTFYKKRKFSAYFTANVIKKLYICEFVWSCLYPKHVETAEPIGLTFVVGLYLLYVYNALF